MKKILFCLAVLFAGAQISNAQDAVKIGIIGLDTSHSLEFTKLLNNKESNDHFVKEFEVIAAYPYGSTNIESTTGWIADFTEKIKPYGVKITDSISELLSMVDCVFLETNDGNLHLEQAAEVFKSGKKVYIDKPLGASLGQVLAIYELADRYGVKFFSSSALRFSPESLKIRNGEYGKVLGADVYSPHQFEKTHPDFGFYGLHGVEILYTVMGTGCKSVTRTHTATGDVVTGIWDNDKIGSFRAITKGPYIYGGTVITDKGAVQAGDYVGYKVLLDEILRFFETGKLPFEKEETIELFTFMKASNMSMAQGGKPVSMEAALKAGQKDAAKLLKAYKEK